MLLTISTTHSPATDLGFLLHKHPARCQEFTMSFGRAYVFYPEATRQRCTAALLLDVDPIGMVRGKAGSTSGRGLEQYVNDRPYVGSSYLSVAISRIFGSSLKGTCKEKPELAKTALPLQARIAVLPCRRGGETFLRKLFEPLGYSVKSERHVLDEKFPDWGQSPYHTVEIEKETTLSEMLTHLYVLIPVLDDNKHYYVGDDEVDKLLAKGGAWLASHPEREAIARRYLKHQPTLAHLALRRLADEDDPEPAGTDESGETEEQALEKAINLNEVRLNEVMQALKSSGATRVLDLGCGEGKLLGRLLKERQFEGITGLDVSIRSLEIASARLHLDRLSPKARKRINLLHGSLLYRDRRLEGFDAVAVVEVIEHLDSFRLATFERVLFEFARPGTVVLTTPNREYNVMWNLGDTADTSKPRLRHGDHRFEWTREEFQAWARGACERFGYAVDFRPVGPEAPDIGPATQMGVFELVRG